MNQLGSRVYSFRLDKSVTVSDLEYEGATVSYCQTSWLLVSRYICCCREQDWSCSRAVAAVIWIRTRWHWTTTHCSSVTNTW